MKYTSIFQRLVFATFAALGANLSRFSAADAPDASNWNVLFEKDLSNAIGGERWKWEAKRSRLLKDHETIWTKRSYSKFHLGS
jgi:hypothetical protein